MSSCRLPIWGRWDARPFRGWAPSGKDVPRAGSRRCALRGARYALCGAARSGAVCMRDARVCEARGGAQSRGAGVGEVFKSNRASFSKCHEKRRRSGVYGLDGVYGLVGCGEGAKRRRVDVGVARGPRLCSRNSPKASASQPEWADRVFACMQAARSVQACSVLRRAKHGKAVHCCIAAKMCKKAVCACAAC